MSCKRTHEIELFLDGELPADRARDLQAHLAMCEACAEELREQEAISRRIRSSPLPMPTPIAMERLARSFKDMRERGVRRLAGWLTAAAAAVAMGVSLNGLTTRDEPVPTASTFETPVLSPDEDLAPATLIAARWMATDLSLGEEKGVTP